MSGYSYLYPFYNSATKRQPTMFDVLVVKITKITSFNLKAQLKNNNSRLRS